MNTYILKNGRVIDPANKVDMVADLFVKDGVIVAPGTEMPKDAIEINLAGCWLVPGLIDMHVHFREPGHEYKEDIESGAKAAAAGGFTAVACMPNTSPVNDNAEVTEFILNKAKGLPVRIYPVGAITKGSNGKELAEYGEMKSAGAVAVSDDGLPVVSSQMMRRSMEYASSHDLVVISHSEDISLSKGGAMNEGVVSTKMGLAGIPAAAEAVMVYRDVAVADLTGHRMHIAHVSTKQSVDIIREAKRKGINVTAETAPHYFTLTEEAVEGYNANAKMSPPLRTKADLLAIREGLADGTLDAIATDHAPHSILEKDLEFDAAANGIVGLESSLPLALNLVREEVIDASRMVELMSTTPAKILGLDGGSLSVGSVADITVIDPEEEFVFTAEDTLSKSKNSPFFGVKMTGRALYTFIAGAKN